MSAVHVAPLQEVTYLVIAGGTDAPGVKIVSDGHGGIKIVPVPGWNPELAQELRSAVSVLVQATRMKNESAAQAILGAAAKVAHAEITKFAGTGTVVIAGVLIFERGL